ncbi:hypothetical protein ACFQ1E_02100 [Sphingomonas canadensis]|uniref:Uncharacterized protein n=1 Tax=Sphingomonas canadensis TaxID=1219257 RepID=A0ABW3H4P2_9SPHN|nr:hypothetical protein [Sphingomonas canadensis]MCW3834967.1 hypothetical protein [Sphingomonas canadensis]
MGLVQIDVGEIAELGTQVAMHGAVRAGEMMVDEVFDLVVGIVALVIEITG